MRGLGEHEHAAGAGVDGGHGPTIEASDVLRAFELLRAVSSQPAPLQPDQHVLATIPVAVSAVVARWR